MGEHGNQGTGHGNHGQVVNPVRDFRVPFRDFRASEFNLFQKLQTFGDLGCGRWRLVLDEVVLDPDFQTGLRIAE